MFTGIIYEKGVVEEVIEKPFGLSLKIKSSLFDDEQIGSSIAVDGVCLTQVHWEKGLSTFEVVKETLLKTTLGNFKKGQSVHLEKSMQANSEIAGHFVQGHVDGTGVILEISPDKLVVELDANESTHTIYKGSIAIDGVSLTIAEVDENKATIALIPHTYEMTHFKSKKAGSKVNIEIDMFAKMIHKYLNQMEFKRAGV